MTKETKENIQDRFLNELREKKTNVNIFLASGIKLTGQIDAFDPYVIVLTGAKTTQLVYKHAISTVVPQA